MVLQGAPLGQAAGVYATPAPILSANSSVTVASIFGPKDYLRRTGQPVTESDSFAATPGTYTLRITNGGLLNQYAPISSAEIHLNGVLIAGPGAFAPQVATITIPVSLNNNNTLQVELRSQ